MNYYKHHIGDYAKKTGALSLIEHGAYLLMLHAYYGTERPLPHGQELYRIAKAHTKAEKLAVDRVADLFWRKTPAGLVNGRAFTEMEAAADLANVARLNGRNGGRPKKPPRLFDQNPSGLENETQRVSKQKAIQTPDSRLQTPDLEIPTQTLPENREGPVLKNGRQNPRDRGTNPRARGTNPRVTGTNPRADRDRRNEDRDAAVEVWHQLTASNGALPERDSKLQAALDAVGGWSRIQHRENGIDAQRLMREFCNAYRESA